MSDPSIYRQLADLEERLRRLETAERPVTFGEAGTWTPAFGLGGGSVGYSTQSGEYGRLRLNGADLIFFHGLIALSSATAPTGNVSVTGLPVAAGERSGAWVIQYDAINLSAGYTMLGGLILAGASSMLLRENGDNLVAQTVQGGALAAATVLEVAGFYIV